MGCYLSERSCEWNRRSVEALSVPQQRSPDHAISPFGRRACGAGTRRHRADLQPNQHSPSTAEWDDLFAEWVGAACLSTECAHAAE